MERPVYDFYKILVFEKENHKVIAIEVIAQAHQADAWKSRIRIQNFTTKFSYNTFLRKQETNQYEKLNEQKNKYVFIVYGMNTLCNQAIDSHGIVRKIKKK